MNPAMSPGLPAIMCVASITFIDLFSAGSAQVRHGITKFLVSQAVDFTGGASETG
jgi:hypothetical protein